MLRILANVAASLALVGSAAAADVTLLNVSYDPTRELYAHLSKAFAQKFNAETGGYNVKLTWDERSAARTGPVERKAYRFQVQGPNAVHVMQKITGQPVPEVKFFNMHDFTIAGKRVRSLRHGMVGQPGWV